MRKRKRKVDKLDGEEWIIQGARLNKEASRKRKRKKYTFSIQQTHANAKSNSLGEQGPIKIRK